MESIAYFWEAVTQWAGERFGWRGILSAFVMGGMLIFVAVWLFAEA